MNPTPPIVLCFSGHDPSGGAGIQADIETLFTHQCHCCSVVTALTEQDTGNVLKLLPQPADEIRSQAKTILADFSISAIKIGLIGHIETAQVIHCILNEHPNIPVIFDPVLSAGGGTPLANSQLIDAIVELLLPYTTLLTPNSVEARKLAGAVDSLAQCGLTLLEKGCEYVLITGTHEDTPSVSNQLYHNNKCIETYTWDRLPDSYHGSGCTLASSIAAMTAHGLDTQTAIFEAQEYTWNTLKNAFKPGNGQYIPNRAFWMQDN
jgi:hydroxymethylpyrimidine/phosphomethylpyrimidine kinase